jgi:hypothetical protein
VDVLTSRESLDLIARLGQPLGRWPHRSVAQSCLQSFFRSRFTAL